MLTTTKEILINARKGKYAIGAFNAENAEMIWAIINAAEELQSPVIIQTTTSTLKYFEAEYFAGIAKSVCEKSSVPIALHLDHGANFDIAKKCIDAGYTAVMIDGSQLPFNENILLTSSVVDYAKVHGIPVEAELGKVGGKEDDTFSVESTYTEPSDAEIFVKKTNIDSLAIAVGTAHGIYKHTPVLDINRIEMIYNVVDIPLVLHGASGLSDAVIKETIIKGISKVNFATELRQAYSEGVKEHLTVNPDVIDPKAYGKVAREKVKELVKQKILICQSNNKAQHFEQ